MRKLSIVICVFVLLACKNEAKSTENDTQMEPVESTETKGRTAKQSDGLTLLKGDFLYMADAAVLQTHREIYAVVIDDKMHELNNKVKKYKKEDTDMVPVEIRGEIKPKPEGEEGWDYRVSIKEILNVLPPNEKDGDVIKLGN